MKSERGVRMGNSYLAAVDIGGTKITASLLNKHGFNARVYQPVQLEGDCNTIPAQVDFLVGYICSLAGIRKNEIAALGISTCGPFKMERGYRVLAAPNLCGRLAKTRGIIPNDWDGIPLEETLSGIFGHLEIENDAVAAARAERLFGSAKNEENLVYITWSTGIGSGAYVDGRLIKGKNGNAPHIGHIYLVDEGPQCGCGNFGDLESLASGTAIARDYGGVSTAREVFLAYRDGDTKARDIVHRAARYFARGLASINAILDTKVFVIGGSVFLNNMDILMTMIKAEFFKSFPALSHCVDFRPSGLDSCLGDMAAMCTVMPEDWIEVWQKNMPWKHAPRQIILEKYNKDSAYK